MFEFERPMAEVIVGQEYGLSANHKLRIGSRIAFHLVNKLLIDLDNTQKDLYNGPSFELDTSVDLGDAPLGLSQRKSNLRTRLYFTSESHIHSLMNCIRHCGHNLLSEEGINFMNRVSEFDYLSQIVIKMYQSTDEIGGQIEILFSSGASHSPFSCDPITHATDVAALVNIARDGLTLAEFEEALRISNEKCQPEFKNVAASFNTPLTISHLKTIQSNEYISGN